MLATTRSAIVTCLWALATAAQAGSSAYARLDGFTVVLEDLNPGDGVAPSIEFLFDEGHPQLYVRSHSSQPDGEVGGGAKTVHGSGPFGATTADITSQRGAAIAALVNATGSLASMSLAVEGSALDPWAAGVRDYVAEYHASVQAPHLDIWGDFRLAPGTRVTIAAVGDVGVAVAPGHAADLQDASAYAQVWMRVMSPAFGDPYFQFSTAGCALGASLSGAAGDGDPPGCGSFDGPSRSVDAIGLSVSFANPSDAALSGHFFALAQASGSMSVNPSPVPEPATAWLWLAGAAGLLAQRRRRAR
ncbi:MAG: PEP-CTERM sorting domain-containing protein [Burkholderiaceae bacterium]|nr:PEP-CTERM sorting domain-containing protein [Burkholderiaceae bacterium]